MTKIRFFLFSTLLLLNGCWLMKDPEYEDFSAKFIGERTELYYDCEKWDFEKFLRIELKENPDMECADLVKFCCQAACGIEHAGENARKKFYDDFNAAASDSDADLIRVTSPDTARVDLGAWKTAGLPPEWLFRMSIAESSFDDSRQKIKEYIDIAASLIPQSKVKFTADEFRKAAAENLKVPHKVHLQHSPAYRLKNPDYRVISSRYFHTIPVLEKAADVSKNQSGKMIIAIDGRSASGKTTMASQLKLILNAQVIHMDDFFLPPNMRTKIRYEQPGGNIHYERFKEDVLPNLRKQTAFSYRIFNCKRNCFHGNRMIWSSNWIIVEGAYSHHPEFGNYADLKVFYDISPEEQMRRIYARNGVKAAEAFRSRWIPLEENYIRCFNIKRNADLIIE